MRKLIMANLFVATLLLTACGGDNVMNNKVNDFQKMSEVEKTQVLEKIPLSERSVFTSYVEKKRLENTMAGKSGNDLFAPSFTIKNAIDEGKKSK